MILDRKIRQMHEAFKKLSTQDFTELKQTAREDDIGRYLKVDFNDCPEEELYNQVSLLIQNIGCIKDHLIHWCKSNNRKFHVEKVINQNKKTVAIIHDLWNIDKHYKLNRKSRSGYTPKVHDLRRVLKQSDGQGSAIQIDSVELKSKTILPNDLTVFSRIVDKDGTIVSSFEIESTGERKYSFTDKASCSIQLIGKIIDETSGNELGDFTEICKAAIDKWEKAMLKAGVPLSS